MALEELFQNVSYWHWLALGAAIMLIEILVPGVIFLWLGIAAVVTGLAFAALPQLSWQIQLVLFAILSVCSLLLGRRFVSSRQKPTDHPTLNRRAETLIGTQYTLETATSGGRGRIRIGDTLWRFTLAPAGEDLSAGSRVTIVGADGSTLIAEEAE